MAQIVLVRVDERLIHGATIAACAPAVRAQKVIAVDDQTANDAFISMIMKGGTNGLPAEIWTLDQTVAEWKANQFGEGRVFVIFKRITDAVKAYKAGFEFPELQLGWLNPGVGRTVVDTRISMTKEEAEMLQELERTTDLKVHLSYTPDLPPVPLDKAIAGKF